MRYDDWDVILFPRDSHVPIQEFKTACYNAQDSKGQQLPTVTCYICSLPPSTPFRISVHSWATTARPSAIIEAQRKAKQKIVYKIQVIVNGVRVFHGCFEVVSRWPQEIAHEKRILAFTEQPTSHRKPYLEFPQFFQQMLMQAAWESKDPNGRINIILSEQLLCKSDKVGESDLGIANDIVCFSFQHAPKEILEQAGISWPIRNPLYLPNVRGGESTSSKIIDSTSRAAKVRDTTGDAHVQSPSSNVSASTFSRLRNPELPQKPNSHLPPSSHFSNAPPSARGRIRPDIWEDSFRSYRGTHDDVSQSSWSTQRSTSNSNSLSDMFMGDCLPTSSHCFKPTVPLTNPPIRYQDDTKPAGTDQRTRRDLDRQVILSLRDDQLDQIIQAISPSKRHRELPHGINEQSHEYIRRPPSVHVYHPPKLGTTTLAGRPSAAALARKSSYPDLNDATQTVLRNPSPDVLHPTEYYKSKFGSTYHPSMSSNKENYSPSQSRLPTAFRYANRAPTPNPFNLKYWDSDISMRDRSSVFSSLNRHDDSEAQGLSETHSKHGTAHAPSNVGGVKSRKEGLMQDSPHLQANAVRHDQSMLPPVSIKHNSVVYETASTSRTTSSMPEREAATAVEIIDVDAIDPSLSPDVPIDSTKLSLYKRNHKPGMSSIDSTGRFEQNLFSALGEELASFDSRGDETLLGPELLDCTAAAADPSENTVLDPAASEFEPAGKRKRQGTLGGERDRSPASKKEKGGEADGEDEEDQKH